MSRFESDVVVDVPVRVAYDQWTQFESFPEFMEGVESVQQLDDRTLSWVADVAGHQERWIARITDQTPETRVAWQSTSGAENAGAVLFDAVGPAQTKVTLRMDVEPEGAVETIGDRLGFLKRQVEGDLERFKEFIEHRGAPEGGWRGEIHGDDVQTPMEGATRRMSRGA